MLTKKNEDTLSKALEPSDELKILQIAEALESSGGIEAIIDNFTKTKPSKALSHEMIKQLNAFTDKCEARYKKAYYSLNKNGTFEDAEEKAEFEKLQSMQAFDWATEERGIVRGWDFEDDQDLEQRVREFIIETFEKIKHEHKEIPLELKNFAFNSIMEAFDDYVRNEGVDFLSFETLEENVIFSTVAVEAVIRNVKKNGDYLEILSQR